MLAYTGINNFIILKHGLLLCCLMLCVVTLSSCKRDGQNFARAVTVNNIGFLIPISYYNPASIPQNNSQQVDVLLKVWLPQIDAYSENVASQAQEEHSVGNLMISSLFNEASKRNARMSFDQRVIEFAKSKAANQQVDDIYGLHYLTRPVGQNFDLEEVFFTGERSNPDTVILCTPDTQNKNIIPHCRMSFEYKNTIASMSFRRKEWLPQWKKIKMGAYEKLELFHSNFVQSIVGEK